MRAAVLSVGDELVIGTTLDTNSRMVSRALLDVGFTTVEHRTVPDDLPSITAAMRQLCAAAHVLIVTGGLGPTADDLTRDALNALLDSSAEMVQDPDRRRDLQRWFEDRGRVMPVINERQAMRPKSALTIHNPHGTAPGLRAMSGGTQIYCLPGPPREMEPMLYASVLPELSRAGHVPVVRMSVQTFGLGESQVAERLGARMDRGRQPAVGTTASQSVVTVQVVAQGELSDERAQAEAEECQRLLTPYAFGGTGETLASALLTVAAAQGVTIAVAESCTAGLVGAALASVPGASANFLGGWIAYSNDLKASELGVDSSIIHEHGAVSVACARAMALGASTRAHAILGISVTGIAGPGGGTPTKPVGTVCIAVHCAGPKPTSAVRRFHFPGDRETVRDRAAKAALQMARWQLLKVDAPMLWEVS